MADVRSVVIAGAGIGGLTLAIALRRRKVPVTVFERATEIRPVGAGLGLASNAIVALERVGVSDAVVKAGAPVRLVALLDTRGRRIGAEIDIAALAREVGAPIVALHRSRLHDVLLDAAGRDVVRLASTIAAYELRDGRVRVTLVGGESFEVDLLVGADGLHSTVRAQLVGDGDPVYSGYTSWRGVTPSGSVACPPRMTETWGRGERFGIVDIGFGEIYWFAVANAAAGGADRDVQAELLARFSRWHEPIARIIAATPADRVLRSDINDREPIERWHEGRVVLLGDAAHPMTPNLGQGAGQAIEDAVVLDDCLATESSIGAALTRYEARRVARANRFVIASRRAGQIAQWQSAAAVWLRNTGMRLIPASAALSQMGKVTAVEL